MNREPTLDPVATPEEVGYDIGLRPRTLDEFVGQQKLKDRLWVCIEAARRRAEPLEHVLLYGPPGLGKTTLAHIVANEMGAPMHVTSGPAVERPGDLVGIVTNLEPGAVLFIDEIHRLSRPVEEILYPALEDFRIDIMIGQGPAARSIRMELPPFTVVGATTRKGLLTGPLRDRFGIVMNLTFYDEESLALIVRRTAAVLGIGVEPDGCHEIARRSRGTPRIANRLLRRVRDYVQIAGGDAVTSDAADKALTTMEVDPTGLDQVDRMLLETIIAKFGGGPVGLDTLAAATGEDPGTVEEVYEPYLMQRGLLQRTPRGRMATRSAYEHLGVPIPEGAAEASLFG